MIRWSEFAWAAFLYGALGGDEEYQKLIRDKDLEIQLRKDPTAVEADEFQAKVIRGFLNAWRCRVESSRQAALDVLSAIADLGPNLKVLGALTLRDITSGHMNVIAECYGQIREVGYHFGATATSKLLHVLHRDLFVMWDKPILERFHKREPRISDSGRGYFFFIQRMQELAVEVDSAFRVASPTLVPPVQANDDAAGYLSARMLYNPQKSLAKYLDEYNWITVTREVQVPPRWHPCP
ncbi:MAG: hypothetical protein WCC94_05315 [Candidatus Bathyarchaeia archaeon]